MKPNSFGGKKRILTFHHRRTPRGFALVISLSLMVLLTVLSVGLLTLSTISLRSSSSAEAMQLARSNARLALMLAIGQLQKSAGPDQRITAPANLVDTNHPSGVAGAWKSWRPPQEAAGDYDNEKDDRFLGYLMSSPQTPASPNPAALPGNGGKEELLVGEGSLGMNSDDREVRAPLVTFDAKGAKDGGALAWATLDEGVKGRIDLLPDTPGSGSTGETITRVGSPARNKAGKMPGLESLDQDDVKLAAVLPKLVSPDEVNLMASDKETFGRYFHDFSVCSSSLQTDAANGGLKTDLSGLFDSASLPGDYASRRLYSGTSSPLGGGITTPDPLWAMYHHHYRLYQRTTGNDNPRDGLKATAGSRYRLGQVTDRTLRDVRYEPDMRTVSESVIMPTMVKVDIVFTLVARDAHGPWPARFTPPNTYPYMLHMMYLPVITLHNPFNVPLRFTQLEVEFADLPMGFQFLVNGQSATSSVQAFNQLYVNQPNGATKKFKLVLTGDLNANREVVMGAGETRIFGKPFPPSWSWDADREGDGKLMFDWRNDQTTKSGSRIIPGMITGPNDGIGYDVDWLAATDRAPWLKTRYTGGQDAGCIPLKRDDIVSVQYGPKTQPNVQNNTKFSVTMRLTPGNSTNNYSTTQIFFKDDARLKSILEEGTSPRFPETRSFPETFPKPTKEAPITAASIHETNSTPVSAYRKARPFALFSLSGKTTLDSFTKSRPVVDTGATFQMATCDFTSSSSQGASPFEFVLTPVRNGSAVVEVDQTGVKGYFFGGHGANRGSTSATFYEIPQAPMQSIAQMRHANAASLGAAPYVTYSIGESRAHPALPASSVKYSPDTTKTLLDHSWLANDQLWDSYWFSTLASLQGTSYTGGSATPQLQLAKSFFAGDKNLPNARNVSYLASGSSPDKAATDATSQRGANTAAFIMTKGGFNVNSVSKSAWISVLTALSDSDVLIASGKLEKTEDDVPMLRVRRPTGGLKEGREAKNQLWTSYRTLTPQQIEQLADEIVKEVRDRGPFLSMSDFVNRRLSGGDFAQKGALQAAIDRCDFNDVMGNLNAMPISSADVGGYGWKNADAVHGTTGNGAPGEISQGDLLSAIGSFVTVRSDTFRIRAFGDARDKDGKVLARAWCEATVQRFPEYVDPDDSAEVAATTNVNIAFGRRFSVVAFRWLHQDEV